MNTCALVLDIGGSHVTSALVALDQRSIVPGSLHRLHLDPQASAEELFRIWIHAAHQAQQHTNVHHIGIGMPGPFDYETGISRLEHKFAAIYGQNLKRELQERLKTSVPIYFGNDAALFGLGEAWAGAAKGYARIIGVTLGTGLGGGFIAQERVLYGGDGIPPEGGIWNLPYLDGIAEDYVSGPALVKQYTAKTGKTLTPLEIAQLAPQHQQAQACFDDLGTHLGYILRPWVISFGANCVVVGGNIARSWDLFASKFALSLNQPEVVLVASKLYDQANLLGAAALSN